MGNTVLEELVVSDDYQKGYDEGLRVGKALGIVLRGKCVEATVELAEGMKLILDRMCELVVTASFGNVADAENVVKELMKVKRNLAI